MYSQLSIDIFAMLLDSMPAYAKRFGNLRVVMAFCQHINHLDFPFCQGIKFYHMQLLEIFLPLDSPKLMSERRLFSTCHLWLVVDIIIHLW